MAVSGLHFHEVVGLMLEELLDVEFPELDEAAEIRDREIDRREQILADVDADFIEEVTDGR